MGQRSQIYVRVWNEREEHPYLIARYFQWNYGDRMISRVRHTIERFKDDEYINQEVNKIGDYLSINFDYKDIVESSDILKDYFRFKEDNLNEFIFSQANNDGMAFIDFLADGSVKYCFTDYDFAILNATEYMDWDHEDWKTANEEYDYTAGVINTCVSNIEYIQNNTTQMTEEELKEFLNYDYSKQVEDLYKSQKTDVLYKLSDLIQTQNNHYTNASTMELETYLTQKYGFGINTELLKPNVDKPILLPSERRVFERLQKEKVFERLQDEIYVNTDWSLETNEQMNILTLKNESPLGEDIAFEVQLEENSNTRYMVEQLVKGITNEYENFDVDEHVEIWVDHRGKNGVPESISALVEDAQDIEKQLKELSDYADEIDIDKMCYTEEEKTKSEQELERE